MLRNVSNQFNTGANFAASDYFQQARLHQRNSNGEVEGQTDDMAINLAETRQPRHSNDAKEKAVLSRSGDYLNVLVSWRSPGETFNLLQKIHALNSTGLPNHVSVIPAVPLSASCISASTQTPQFASSASAPSSIQTKSELVDYLFEKMFSALGALEVPHIPRLFLVYAHDNSAQGRAEAETSRYLIDKLKQIRVLNLYSDQTPLGQSYSGERKTWKQNGQLTDILTSQLCLLPDQLRDDVELVDKVVVCCSEVLGNYLQGWSHYEAFYQALQEAYEQDLKQKSTSAIREVVNAFSQKKNFHHVLTEMAFLQIRAKKRGDRHDIIPVLLTPNSYEQCLAHFIPETTVRMGDIYRLERHAQAGKEVYSNQGRHGVLFKLIERLLIGHKEAQAFLDNFWQGYSNLLSWLEDESSMFPLGGSGLKLIKLVDRIFGDVERELHKKLFSTAQQFCDSGWQQAVMQLLDQLQNLFPLCMQNAEILQRLLPPHFSSIELRETLRRYYERSDLSIQRVSGEKASLEACYINLAIIESQMQRKKDKKELGKQAKTFERLPSDEQLEAANLDKLISLDQIFEKQKLQDGKEAIPKRILIQGRAGIGKTTLCKKLVYEYHHNKLWQDQFDCVLWVPLRQLKTFSPQRFEDLLCNHYFRSHEKIRAEALAKAFYGHQNKTLFILDGLDEVIGELNDRSPLKGFLEELLDQKHVVITSRPAGVDTRVLGQLDLELETIGFSPDNVQTYIKKFAPESNQTEIQQFINRTPVVQGLVNIPIQLDALCHSWDRLPKDQSVTMSMLYDAMIDKLWRKDGDRLEKEAKAGKPFGLSILQDLSKARIESIMASEIYYLGYLAFKGLEGEQTQIEFSIDELDEYQTELEIHSPQGLNLPHDFTIDLKKTSFLHTADNHLPESQRTYHFLHLTFQEFFAAKFLVKYLQTYSKVEDTSVYVVQKSLGVIPERKELEAFIATHKYNPRYEIVWWMIAGLLKGAGLENFFHVLNQAPRDLIGMRHQQVALGCLNEARTQLKAGTVARLETECMQWLNFEIKNRPANHSHLGRQRIFPEYLLLKALSQAGAEKKQTIIMTLRERPILSDKAIQALIDALKDENADVRYEAASALSAQHVLTDSAIQPLINVLKDKNENVRSMAAYTLGSLRALPENVIEALVDSLKDESGRVRFEAAMALCSQCELPDDTIQILITSLKDESEEFKFATIDSLDYRQRALSDDTVQTLIDDLKEKNADIRSAAARDLGRQRALSEHAAEALVSALKDESVEVRDEAAAALGRKDTLPGNAIQTLISYLKDENEDVRFNAVNTLYILPELPDNAIQPLIEALRDENECTRSVAASTLCRSDGLPDNAVGALIDALNDEDKYVRFEAAITLSHQSVLSADVIQILTNVLKDEDQENRDRAAYTLGSQRALPDNTIEALMDALIDNDDEVRNGAVSALSSQYTLSDNVIDTLVNFLKNTDNEVRSAAAEVLSSHMNQLFTALMRMDRSQIKALYTQCLFPHSSEQIAALYIQGNQLHFYTATGPGQLIQPTTEQRQMLSEAFSAVQAKAGILSPEKAELALIEA